MFYSGTTLGGWAPVSQLRKVIDPCCRFPSEARAILSVDCPRQPTAISVEHHFQTKNSFYRIAVFKFVFPSLSLLSQLRDQCESNGRGERSHSSCRRTSSRFRTHGGHIKVRRDNRLRSGGFDPLPSDLPPVQANQPRLLLTIQFLVPFNLFIAN